MSETLRTTIKEVPSGKIELVLLEGTYMALQFNGACLDMIHYCKAMCCRLRSGLAVTVEPEEAGKFLTKLSSRGLVVLQSKPEDDSCIYLDSESLCQLHSKGGPTAKPLMCQFWHCSPGGVGENIKFRDGGWFMSPLGPLVKSIQEEREVAGTKR